MASVLKDIFALEEQHRCGCLSDLEFAAAVAAVLPDTADNAAQHPVWLTAVANEVAQLDAEWKREQFDRHAIPVRGGWILPSRWLAATFCASPVVGIPLFAFFFWPVITTLSDRFREAGWQAWVALVVLVLVPVALVPALVYWWAIDFERAESDFQRRRAAIILRALRLTRAGGK